MDINEIARRAGVSRATVSRYLNNGYVSQEKRELIRRIIMETGYMPSRHAQQLRTGKAHLVGAVIPKINSQSVSRMVAGITDVLTENNYQLVLANTNNNQSLEVDYLKMFKDRTRVDGIILIATVLTNAHLAMMDSIDVPIVVLGQDFKGYTSVYQNDYHAMRDLTRLVLPKARRVAYVGVLEEDEAAGHQRHQGFLDACAEKGIEVLPQAQQIVGFDADSGYFGAERILYDVPDVDTIVCATDDIAFGAMMCMHEYGKSVPEDIQVAGMGDSLLSRIVHPSLTTVHLHYKTGGATAAYKLLDLMKERPREVEKTIMPYEVYGRNSMR